MPQTKEEEQNLIESAPLISTDNALGANLNAYDGISKNERVAKLIVKNTLRTMQDAGQLEYLRRSGIVGPSWKILVEIHYYRDRGSGVGSLHKDTLGQTLFVNLNTSPRMRSQGPSSCRTRRLSATSRGCCPTSSSPT